MNSIPYSDYVIFVDESGDHGLKSIDPEYPVFILDFCIFRKDCYARAVVPRVQEFKFRHFGHDLVVLHERDIRKEGPPFVFQSQDKREAFIEELTRLVDEAEFTIVASVIDKERHVELYTYPDNPYHVALLFCMERARNLLREQEQHENITHIVVEKRGKREDRELELEFRRIRDGGIVSSGLKPRSPMPNFEIVFADKRINSAGLQLADLTARPIGRRVLDQQSTRPWEVIEKKLLRGSVSDWYWGHGLKIFPTESPLHEGLVSPS